MYYAIHYLGLLIIANEQLFQRFKWVGNGLLMTAAMSVAVSAEWAQHAWPFVLYTIGAGMWMYAGMIMKDKALVGLNLFFVVIDVYAIIIRL